jgi:DNA-directed RNA polymerase subunit N (RpoN/RPB10)
MWVKLRCITCGDSDFEFNDDKSWIKCNRCGKEYPEGYDELVKLNQELINQELDKSKEEILKDTQKDIADMLKEAFKGNKNIKFKG